MLHKQMFMQNYLFKHDKKTPSMRSLYKKFYIKTRANF